VEFVTIVRQDAQLARVLPSEAPLPELQRRRLERAGFTVESATAQRVARAADYADLVTPMLQRDLFAF